MPDQLRAFVASCEAFGGAVRAELGLGGPRGRRAGGVLRGLRGSARDAVTGRRRHAHGQAGRASPGRCRRHRRAFEQVIFEEHPEGIGAGHGEHLARSRQGADPVDDRTDVTRAQLIATGQFI